MEKSERCERIEELLEFWFGELDPDGRADQVRSRRWYMKDEAFDQELRERFGAEHSAAITGENNHWIETTRGRLALVILLDQLSRNMYRGTARMFAADEQALQVALEGIAQGLDRTLALDERAFLYMPLMHSESLELQERCVELFTAFRDELAGEARAQVARSLEFAIKHRDIVKRWGRFPHRNEILGRVSTPEEERFLEGPGSSF